MTAHNGFRERLLAREALIGTFCKTPSHIIGEVLGKTELDCVCLDAEHAPFGRTELDVSVSALRAASMPSIVRVPHATPESVLNALDCGATGVMAPHIRTPDEAARLAHSAQYGQGRGYAGSSRAAGYTTRSMSEHLAKSARDTTTIAQIEDLEALEHLDDIAKVEGIDCLFVGRIDLAVAMACAPSEPPVVDAVRAICRAGLDADRRVGMFVADLDEIPMWLDQGASLFILKSDHSFLLEGAEALRARFDTAAKGRS
ncbi:MAG: aldolase/citrate lyase family protein [Pseudomonadota bacterium]